MELTLSQQRRRTAVSTLGDPKILGPAVLDAFRKLDPRLMVRNPVMFTVEVVASLTTVLFIRDLVTGSGRAGLFLPDQSLALVHGAVRELRRSGRRRPRQGPGRDLAQGQDRNRRQAAGGRLGHQVADRSGDPAQEGRRRAGRDGRSHPVRRRGDRGRGLGQRSRDHRRIGAGHPRKRRRSLGGHRRHPGDLGLDQGSHYRPARLDLPRPHDRPGRGRRAAEDAERDRAQHPARRHVDHLRLLGGDDPELRRLCRRHHDACWCWWRCSSP